MNKSGKLLGGALFGLVAVLLTAFAGCSKEPPVTPKALSKAVAAKAEGEPNYLRAVYDPIHFKPAIETAKDEQCLACHQEILNDKPRETSPAGIKTVSTKAWYQRLSTYQGAQDTFHRRHLTSDYAKEVMDLKCNTCHQGNEPRDEAPGASANGIPQTTTDVTLRKHVNPETICLKCHGRHNAPIMGLPGPWEESKEAFQNNCLLCHAAIRTTRHQVNYLKPAAIEKAGERSGDACYGCHGGRSWYRMTYPYPRHAWEGMAPEVPDWAKDRPTESEARFRLPVAQAAATPSAPAAPSAVPAQPAAK